ncbi:MAG TPA: lysoplasmalogenase [Bacillota bacterium]|nr:lysoplasmalogenase [Bacillota bacterium]HOB86108.1 lysoplasmalogenase [Bacillota bacterium]HOP68671.1 lysoplasmalogenase [Bacillota bacterium]HPT34206.1 lysoplasmalogenase [Bacillota bacterium]HPZ64221.1 lysoplasmalogenase [Bacillota bacterium]
MLGWIWAWRKGPDPQENSLILPLPVRVLLTTSLLAAAFLISRAQGTGPYADWVLGGMFFSFIGDLIMAGIIKVPVRLIGGMLAFSLGHFFYMNAFARTMLFFEKPWPNPAFWLFLALLWSLNLAGWLRLVRRKGKAPGKVKTAALLYGLWIGTMLSLAFDLAITLGGLWWLTAAGAFLFAFSDALIGATRIATLKVKNVRLLIWGTYLAAQMGIIYAGWFA